MKRRAAILTLILLVAIGYMVGSYFVGYALRRGNEADPKAVPAGCAAIHDPSAVIPPRPEAASEAWSLVSEDGLTLRGTHFSPPVPSHRWAILVHGYGRDQRFVRDVAAEYLRRGYEVLTPDMRAAGESDGTYLTMGVKESEDVAAWARQIVSRDDEARIALHGISMGAATAMMAAGRDGMPPQVAALVEDCGYTSAYVMFSAQLKKLFGLPAFPVMNCVDVVSRIKTGAWLSDAAPVERMPTLPTLFIHGEADGLAPVKMLDELCEASGAKVKARLVLPGVGHADAKQDAPTLYYETVFSFLEPYMGDPRRRPEPGAAEKP